MSQSKAAPLGDDKSAGLSKQLALKDFKQRVRDCLQSINDNFDRIIRLVKLEDEAVSSRQLNRVTAFQQETFEIQVRTANLVRATESLLKIIADLKTFVVLNDFDYITSAIENNRAESLAEQRRIAQQIGLVKEGISRQLDQVDTTLSSCPAPFSSSILPFSHYL